MRIRIYSLLLLLLTSALLFSQGELADVAARLRQPALRLRCRIALDKEKYEVGEPIVVDVELHNSGDKPLQVAESSEMTGRLDGFHFEVRTQQGEILRDPVNESISGMHAIGSNGAIAPSKSYFRKLTLNHRVSTLKPGVYSVRCVYSPHRGTSALKTESAWVLFEVRQTPASALRARVEALAQQIDGGKDLNTVARLLGFTGDVAAIPPLIRILQTGDDQTQVAAIEALCYLDQAAVKPALIDSLKKEGPRERSVHFMAVTLRTPPLEMIPLLLPWLKSEDADRRQAVLEGIRLLQANREKDQRLLPYLVAMLKDPSANVRLRTVAAIGEYGDKKALDAIKSLLDDPDEHVREQVTIAIGWVGTSEAVEILLQVLEKQARAAQQAAYWLGRIGDKRAIDGLEKVLRSAKDPDLRRETAAALKSLKAKP